MNNNSRLVRSKKGIMDNDNGCQFYIVNLGCASRVVLKSRLLF